MRKKLFMQLLSFPNKIIINYKEKKSHFTLHQSAWHHLKHQMVKIHEQIV